MSSSNFSAFERDRQVREPNIVFIPNNHLNQLVTSGPYYYFNNSFAIIPGSCFQFLILNLDRLQWEIGVKQFYKSNTFISHGKVFLVIDGNFYVLKRNQLLVKCLYLNQLLFLCPRWSAYQKGQDKNAIADISESHVPNSPDVHFKIFASVHLH